MPHRLIRACASRSPCCRHRPGFSDFPYLHCIKMSYHPFFTRKKHCFRKEFLDNTFLKTLFVLSRASDNTTSQNIGGTDRLHIGRPPTSHFLEDRPPRSPPLLLQGPSIKYVTLFLANFAPPLSHPGTPPTSTSHILDTPFLIGL